MVSVNVQQIRVTKLYNIMTIFAKAKSRIKVSNPWPDVLVPGSLFDSLKNTNKVFE